LQRFFEKVKHFPDDGTDLKMSLDGATIGARMTKKNSKSEKMGAKFVFCAPLRPFRSKVKDNFYHSLLSHVL